MLPMAAAAALSSPLSGTLFRYKAASWPAALQAFESPHAHSYTKFAIYLGGLTDGLLACSYVEALGHQLEQCGWSLVQPVLTSSYAGYGCSSLVKDAEEIAELCAHLERSRQVSAFAIIGHSTGCQDAVTVLANAPPSIRCLLRAAILQAPVSDREAASLEGDATERNAQLAQALQLVEAGKGTALLPEMHYGFVPMTAARYVSLVGRGGPDDMFSSDFSDDELAARLGHMGTAGQREGRAAQAGQAAIEPAPNHPGLRTLFVHSGADEYVPASVDVSALSQRFVRAAGGVLEMCCMLCSCACAVHVPARHGTRSLLISSAIRHARSQRMHSTTPTIRANQPWASVCRRCREWRCSSHHPKCQSQPGQARRTGRAKVCCRSRQAALRHLMRGDGARVIRAGRMEVCTQRAAYSLYTRSRSQDTTHGHEYGRQDSKLVSVQGCSLLVCELGPC